MDPLHPAGVLDDFHTEPLDGGSARTEQIIDVLSHLQQATETEDELDGWSSEQLKAEVLRLRRLTSSESLDVNHAPLGGPGKRKLSEKDVKSRDGKKVKEKAGRDEGTGKRLEKGRRTELGKAIRANMRLAMGISPDDPLPNPNLEADPSTSSSSAIAYHFIPNWLAPNDRQNISWVGRMTDDLLVEARTGQWPDIPEEDLDLNIIRASARTAFQNFCRRYVSETDPEQAGRKERYAKGRRRWARKDLKQRKRARASLDPLFNTDIPLPTAALQMDYMSSEYSSAGEDSTEDQNVTARRKEKWASMSAEGKEDGIEGGWAEGLAEKVLEVRTPRWRSDTLNDLYRQLDEISSRQASARSNPGSTNDSVGMAGGPARAGHVAPSHRRFTMSRSIMRKGKRPRDAGEGWMWASGQVGVWPEREAGASSRPSGNLEHSVDPAEAGADVIVNDVGWPEEEAKGLVDALQDIANDTS